MRHKQSFKINEAKPDRTKWRNRQIFNHKKHYPNSVLVIGRKTRKE